ncbi:binding-protein-dependent transport systems inner membrane component [Rhodoferax ferrireducens T118]|uniref:Binding-protein-dependent transport systems inner membrane component n=1 Tax=Albidiferax ferrireducens (strain ATCC BAA-621 / DSM 15236 / T118) TaxID=338969 RepID=Q222E5_ALBFT|nr:ABC transporter permease subunit [Rhodoferax ferrireducens]ABD68108.1 binding-protein-dependent transport systems inner membrane component [Rhodoferax ferrireducens T118]WPC67229.1 ABC transporter permease subunit [Rhodoferax ferrireducens]
MAKLNLTLPGRRFVIGVPAVWLVLFFMLPFLILLYISFVDMGNDISPFKPIWDSETGLLKLKYENYYSIFQSSDGSGLFQTIYIEAYVRSIWYALCTAVLCLVIGYPFSYFIARSAPNLRPALLMMVMLPFWTSFLLRVYAWKGILADQGVLNQMLLALGLITEPMQMLYTDVSMLVGMTYVYLPFMVLPLYANLVKMDIRLLEAAYDLGASPFKAFWLVTVPLSKAGIIAGFMLVFIPCVGEFVIPSLLGGPENIMIGRVVWDEMFTSNNWPRASALAVVMIGLIVVPLAVYYHFTGDAAEVRR